MKKIYLLLLILFASYQIFSQNTNKNLIAHYKFDNNANDMSLYQNNGFLIGSVKPTKNRFNIDCSAYEFDGKTGYVLIDQNKALETITDNFTITAWAKLSPASKNFWFTICCKSDQSYENMDSPHFRLQLTKKTASINSDFTCEWNQNFTLDKWYFFSVTVNKNSPKYYINGALVIDTTFKNNLQSNKYALTIGRDKPGNDEFFYGSIDDFRIYNKVLNLNEIKEIFNDKTELNLKSPCALDTVKQVVTKIDTVRNTILHTDTIKKTIVKTDTLHKVVRDTININNYSDLPQEIDGIKINYQKIIIVNSRNLKLIPYDDVREDNDTVSININGTWVREHYKIKNKDNMDKKNDPPINCTLISTNNFLISRAWNLGESPPNTLALDIYDGINPVQKVIIHSEIGLSGGIKIIYKQKK